MDEILYQALVKYYHVLEVKGYISKNNSDKLLILIFLSDFVYRDFKGLLSREDYRLIERAMDCIYGTSCLIPYPVYLKMGKLHLSDISEIAERVKALEDTNVVKVMQDAESSTDSDIVIEGEDSED